MGRPLWCNTAFGFSREPKAALLQATHPSCSQSSMKHRRVASPSTNGRKCATSSRIRIRSATHSRWFFNGRTRLRMSTKLLKAQAPHHTLLPHPLQIISVDSRECPADDRVNGPNIRSIRNPDQRMRGWPFSLHSTRPMVPQASHVKSAPYRFLAAIVYIVHQTRTSSKQQLAGIRQYNRNFPAEAV